MMAEQRVLTELTAEIVAAHVANNTVSLGDVPLLIEQVHGALTKVGGWKDASPSRKSPMVSIRASVKPDYLVCLECGRKQKTLRRHLMAVHSLTPDEYRQDYGLPASYPMTSKNYSDARREMASRAGLGREDRPKQRRLR